MIELAKEYQHYLFLMVLLFLGAVLPDTAPNLIFYLWLFLISVCIGRAGYEYAKLRREAWLRQYLKASSSLQSSLAVGLLSLAIIVPVAVFLSVVLLLNLRMGGWAVWIPVLIGFLVFPWSRKTLLKRVDEHVVESYTDPVARKVSVFPTALTMIAFSLLISMSVSHPNVEGMGWLQMIDKGTGQIEGTGMLAFLDRLYLGISLTEYWAIQNTIKSLGTPVLLNILGWGLFFLSQCAFVWAFCRLMVGVESLRKALQR